MGIQADISEGIDGGRDDLVRALAEHRVLPSVVEGTGGSGLLGKSRAPTTKLERADGESAAIDRQTTAKVADTLGIDSEEDCEAVRGEIRGHAAWE